MKPAVKYSFDLESGVARITFNRPEVLNAINLELALSLLSAVKDLSLQENLRCIVMTGAGRAFMAGGDVSTFAGGADKAAASVNELLDALHAAILGLRNLDAPILAGVQGVAAGAGLSLALVADVVLAAEDTQFRMGYDRLATVPDCGGTWSLMQRIGYGRATDLMTLGRILSGNEAKDWGLVNRTVPSSDFASELDTLARKLARGPSKAYAAFRRLAEAAIGRSLGDQLEAERKAFVALTRSSDFAEGVTAFLTKRLPVFGGY